MMKFFGGTKEPTEMDRTMENIAKVEGELQQKIFQLGQLYYDEHKNSAGSDMEEKYYQLVDLINKLDQNRIGFYKNKLRLEGKMLCENCGAEIPFGSMYCSFCGQKADEKQTEKPAEAAPGVSERKCTQCGAVLEEGNLFCTACGAKVE